MKNNTGVDKDQITVLMAEIFGKEPRTARRDRDFLANAGLLDLVAPGRGGARRWTAWGVSNFSVAETCGLPITEVATHVPAINALPIVPAWSHTERPEAFDDGLGLAFRRSATLCL